MKKIIENIAYYSLVLLLSIGLTFVVYKCTPQYLCYTVHDIHASNLYDRNDMSVGSGTEIEQIFIPQGKYIKGIIINAGYNGKSDEKFIVTGQLKNREGKVIAEKQVPLNKLTYCTFEFETWVNEGEVYSHCVIFPKQEGGVVTLGPKDIGPSEQAELIINGQSSENSMYVQYIYGDYSKKLLVVWWGAFLVSLLFIGDCLLYKLKGKKRY